MYHTWLRSFHAVAIEGGFTAASRALNVGQPTITAQVKALENSFGVELFRRRGRSVELTDTGRSLLFITHGLFGHEDEAIRFLSAVKELRAGQLHVGSITPYVVVEVLEEFQKRFPEVQLKVSLGHGESVIQSLREFEIDVALLSHRETDPRMFVMPYTSYQIVAIVGADHKWAGRDEIDVTDLAGEKMIMREPGSTTRQIVERVAAEAGFRLHNFMEINSREAVCQAVMRGMGVGIISEVEFTPHSRLRPVRISHPAMRTQFYVTCLAMRQERPLIDSFIELARERGD